jgi:hypothetical protein
MKRIGCLLILALAGCGAPGPVATHPVSGSVSYEGKPAAGVKVFLVPTSAPVPPEIPQNPYGVTDDSGRFKLTTYKDGDGAAEGGYQIVLLWPQGDAASEEEGTVQDRFFGWFTVAHTKLTAQIKPGPNELTPIRIPTIKGPPGKIQGIPGRN